MQLCTKLYVMAVRVLIGVLQCYIEGYRNYLSFCKKFHRCKYALKVI